MATCLVLQHQVSPQVSPTTPGFVVTVDYIHVSHPALTFLSCRHPDSGCRSAQGYSVFQTLPSLFAPPLSLPTNYQTDRSGARLYASVDC